MFCGEMRLKSFNSESSFSAFEFNLTGNVSLTSMRLEPRSCAQSIAPSPALPPTFSCGVHLSSGWTIDPRLGRGSFHKAT